MGDRIATSSALGGGCVGDVRRVVLESGRALVVKLDQSSSPSLAIEARMLRDLRERSALPVPEVVMSDDDLLVMDFVEHDGHLGPSGEEHAAALLAELHGVSPCAVGAGPDRFGYDLDTLIGGLHQPNGWRDSWIEFFGECRLREMARQAHDAGRLDVKDRARIDDLTDQLDRWLREPEAPALIHGDVWGGNVLAHEGRIAAFIDPAVYFAHAEIELAFIRLFGTFSSRFFEAYAERRPIVDGFFEEHCDLYNLYPLLVHVRLFGGSYVDQVRRTLRRFGV